MMECGLGFAMLSETDAALYLTAIAATAAACLLHSPASSFLQTLAALRNSQLLKDVLSTMEFDW